jgi:hypothetical protein
MRELFDSARRILADSVDTVMIVIEHETRVAGLLVDHMETVVDIDEDRITTEMTVLRSCPYLMGLAQLDQFNGTVLLACPATILQAIDGKCGHFRPPERPRHAWLASASKQTRVWTTSTPTHTMMILGD